MTAASSSRAPARPAPRSGPVPAVALGTSPLRCTGRTAGKAEPWSSAGGRGSRSVVAVDDRAYGEDDHDDHQDQNGQAQDHGRTVLGPDPPQPLRNSGPTSAPS